LGSGLWPDVCALAEAAGVPAVVALAAAIISSLVAVGITAPALLLVSVAVIIGVVPVGPDLAASASSPSTGGPAVAIMVVPSIASELAVAAGGSAPPTRLIASEAAISIAVTSVIASRLVPPVASRGSLFLEFR
jgi:hypothetical protein